jgi:hypothetical protein
MGDIHDPLPVLLILAVSSRYEEALAWTRQRAEENFGSIALASDAFEFTETAYYADTMGADLKKQFLACARPIDPAELARIKRATNAWEADYAALDRHAEPRPLNVDPGYITRAKLVLASTKDHAHRIYLQQGIYAEITLAYRHRQWQPHEWTYPDYRRADYQEFFTRCREYLSERAND